MQWGEFQDTAARLRKVQRKGIGVRQLVARITLFSTVACAHRGFSGGVGSIALHANRRRCSEPSAVDRSARPPTVGATNVTDCTRLTSFNDPHAWLVMPQIAAASHRILSGSKLPHSTAAVAREPGGRIRASLRHDGQAREKRTGKIDKKVAENGGKWRFCEGSQSAISRSPSRRHGSQPVSPADLYVS